MVKVFRRKVAPAAAPLAAATPVTADTADTDIVAPPAAETPVSVTPPGEPAPAKDTTGYVTFSTRRPGLQVILGTNRSVVFDGTEATVDPATAEILKNHFLFHQGHILLKEDTVVENGQLVELTAEAKAARAAKADGKCVFSFSENPVAQLTLIPGKLTLEFCHGYVAVDEATAALLRKHTFFVQGRLHEI